MFSSRSSTPPLRFPAPLGPWKDGIGNSVLLSGLLQMMSVEEQEQEGGQSGRSPRPLWRRTGNRIRAFQSGNIDPRTSIPHKKDVGPFILLTLKHGQKNNKPRKFAQSITAALSSFLSLQPKRSVARERSVCVCARLIERSQVWRRHTHFRAGVLTSFWHENDNVLKIYQYICIYKIYIKSLSLSLCIYIYIYICTYNLYISYPSIHLSTSPSILSSIHSSVHLSIHPFFNPSVHSSIHPSFSFFFLFWRVGCITQMLKLFLCRSLSFCHDPWFVRLQKNWLFFFLFLLIHICTIIKQVCIFA